MTLGVGLIVAALGIMLLASFCAALASRIFYGPTARWLGTIPPATRANFQLAWALAPFLTGLVALLLIFSPSLAHLLGFAADHCHSHSHHAHLCPAHTPLFTGTILERLILAIMSVVALRYVLKTGWRLRRSHRALRTLLVLVKPSIACAPYRVVDSPRPFAITAGLVRPQVLVSSRLIEDLRPTELATVVSHEQAHQRRRDGMRLFAAEVLSGLHLPTTRRLILDDLGLAIEQACDEAAARSGDRLQVAETIIKMARLVAGFKPVPGPIGASITDSNVVTRVEELLRPVRPVCPRLGAGACLLASVVIAVGLASGDWWHHSAETLFVGLLLG